MSISRIVKERTDAGRSDSLPLNVAMPIETWQQQVVLDEPADGLRDGLLLEERRENEIDAILNFHVGMFRNNAVDTH